MTSTVESTVEKQARGHLSTAGVVFMVLAAAAPMGAIVGIAPLSIGFGDGIGTPGAYAFAALVLLCFACGYAAMSGRITNAGAFYSYVSHGLGRLAGGAVGWVAALSYLVYGIGVVGALGYFANLVGTSVFDVSVPWEWGSGVGLALVAFLGYRSVELSARVLGVALVCEVGVLLVVSATTFVKNGPSSYPISSFSPATVFSGTAGVAIMYAFTSFIGFEATAIYGGESRNPKRTVPRATYVAIAIIGIFYTLVSWSLISAYGASHAAKAAATDPGNFVFGAVGEYLDQFAVKVVSVLVVTSLFAASLAFHNAAARYIQALSRDGIMAKYLGKEHPKHQAPSRASLVCTAVTAVVVAAFALAHQDPYLSLGVSMISLGTVGILAVQAAAAIAIVCYFRRQGERASWTTAIAPALGMIGLLSAIVLVLSHYSILTGSKSGLINNLPWLLLVMAALGLLMSVRLRSTDAVKFAQLGLNDLT
jgi:amino acid transporter